MGKIWKKFYECECGGHGIMVSEEYIEIDTKKVEGCIDLAFFKYGWDGNELTFRDKIRWCWSILLQGKPWVDMVILNKKVAKQLGKDLIKWGESK